VGEGKTNWLFSRGAREALSSSAGHKFGLAGEETHWLQRRPRVLGRSFFQQKNEDVEEEEESVLRGGKPLQLSSAPLLSSPLSTDEDGRNFLHPLSVGALTNARKVSPLADGHGGGGGGEHPNFLGRRRLWLPSPLTALRKSCREGEARGRGKKF